MKRNWMGVVAGLSVLVAATMATAAPGQHGSYDRGGVRNSAPAQQGRGSFTRPTQPGRGSFTRPATTYSRPVVVRPTYSRPVVVRPTYSRPGFAQPTYSRPGFGRTAYSRPAVFTAYHRGWLSRLSTLSASAYRFSQFSHYSIAARQAELTRLETELATIQANQGWVSSYSEYSELVQHILSLRAALGVYAPPPLANLSLV